MKILIIGGTRFLGRALVSAALERGHQVTLFNRGQTNPELFPQVEEIHGDRKESLSALEGGRWDAVIDTCGYFPADVQRSAEFLAGKAGHYTFISSISVYASFKERGLDESSPVGRLKDANVQEINETTYGPLKVLCEEAAEAAMPGRVLTLRPGLIVGPYDPTDRFTYWPYRVSLGGEVLAPGRPERADQFIDVRDLAEWNLRMIEAGRTGIFNATGPEEPLPMGDLLEACRRVSESGAVFTWVSEPFLLQNGVQPWSELPLWVPESDADMAGMSAASIRKALHDGLTFRPLEETLRATLEWAQSRPAQYEWRAGMKPERERRLLESYRTIQ
jgi:2'-hydroxyisoflavone reductase